MNNGYSTKLCRKNRGSTMVEVLIGFTLLIILVTGFTKIINLSNNMIILSKDMIYEAELLEEKLYKGTDVTAEYDKVSLVETEDYSGLGARSIKLDDVTVQTYSITGNDGELYISRFSDKGDDN